MTVTEFLAGRTVERQAVTRYIERHPEEFANHTSKNGKEIVLDDVAVEILDKKYPLAKPVQVIEGVAPEEHEKLYKKYTAALERLEAFSEWKADQIQLLAESEQKYNMLMLQSQIDQEAAVSEAVKLREEELNREHRAEVEKIQNEAAEAIKAEKNRKLTLRERILGRKNE